MLRLKKLEKSENCRTRALYEEIFAEDSERFVDYYYSCKASENEIYVIEEYDHAEKGREWAEVVSMLHLNPYRLSVCGSEKKCHYIVAVATKERCRHQGMMKRLIHASLGDMYEQREPFTFLMPAAEAIYHPFGFRYMSSRRTAELKRSSVLKYSANDCGSRPGLAAAEEKGRLWCVPAGPGDAQALSEFSGQYMKENYDIYAVRSRHYFQRLLKEQECEGGRIVQLKEAGGLAGYFLAPDRAALPEEQPAEVREAVVKKELVEQLPGIVSGWLDSSRKIRFLDFGEGLERVLSERYGAGSEQTPLMMGRIVHLESLMESLRTERQFSFYMIVEDEILVQNSGAYFCTLGRRESSCRRVMEGEARDNGAKVISAAGLGEEIFKSKKIFLDEIV